MAPWAPAQAFDLQLSRQQAAKFSAEGENTCSILQKNPLQRWNLVLRFSEVKPDSQKASDHHELQFLATQHCGKQN